MAIESFIQQLKDENIGKVFPNEPLAKHTTWKIGGPADVLVIPNSEQSLIQLLSLINEHQLPWRAIGRGSNLLVNDAGIEGVVIKLADGLDELTIQDDTITVGGGYPLIKLATVISKKGLSGFEFAGGIPGSVGGAVFMNAGAHGSDISQILLRALILFADGRLEWLSNEELAFSYRTSRLQKEQGICVKAVFKLSKGNKEEIVALMQKNKDYRRDSQPWDHPCAGSVFRNPLPHYAGALIEKSGLKGYQIGGAQISTMHGNFIVNVNEATCEDVLKLIEHVKATILAEYGIEIETEVEIVERGK